MDGFVEKLKNEYISRRSKNRAYSLRAFGRTLGVSHATLSSIMAGKRKVTTRTLHDLGKKMGLSPIEIAGLEKGDSGIGRTNSGFFSIKQDHYQYISEWYFDAILELISLDSEIDQQTIMVRLGLSQIEVEAALEKLSRLDLIVVEKNRMRLSNRNSTNILDDDYTSAANRTHQAQLLKMSLEALEQYPRSVRDHSSMTVAVNSEQLQELKRMITHFRRSVSSLLEEANSAAEIYQLQISLFPLTRVEPEEQKI